MGSLGCDVEARSTNRATMFYYVVCNLFSCIISWTTCETSVLLCLIQHSSACGSDDDREEEENSTSLDNFIYCLEKLKRLFMWEQCRKARTPPASLFCSSTSQGFPRNQRTPYSVSTYFIATINNQSCFARTLGGTDILSHVKIIWTSFSGCVLDESCPESCCTSP